MVICCQTVICIRPYPHICRRTDVCGVGTVNGAVIRGLVTAYLAEDPIILLLCESTPIVEVPVGNTKSLIVPGGHRVLHFSTRARARMFYRNRICAGTWERSNCNEISECR